VRKLVVLTFVSLDGVMQAPGGPKEDTSGGFEYGGWTFAYFDDALGQEMAKQMTPPFDLLLGRITYDIFAGYWPNQPDSDATAKVLNEAKKYVASYETRELKWQNSELLTGDVVSQIKALKSGDGPMLQARASACLATARLPAPLNFLNPRSQTAAP
jgi:dihydrofolate reductase